MSEETQVTLIEEGEETRLELKSNEEVQSLASEVTRLSSYWQDRLGLPFEPITSRVQGRRIYLKARAVSGVVSIGRFDVSIVPKYLEQIRRNRRWEVALIRMLTHSGGERFAYSDQISADQGTSNFTDLLARAYAQALSSALENGIPRSYERNKAWLSTARGKLRADMLYPEVLLDPQKVPCEFDNYTVNTPVTQLLKWAALRFGNLSIGNQTANHLQRLASEMRGVSPDRPSSALEVDRLSLSPQYRHCLPALRLARWLAKDKGAVPEKGSAELPGLLLHSDRIFESFVDSVMKAACHECNLSYRKKREMLSNSHGGISTRPDGQIAQDGATFAVVDAKYKEWIDHPKASDVYQVMAGSRVLECDRAILVYPYETPRAPKHWNLEGEGHPETVSALFIPPTSMTEPEGFSRLVFHTIKHLNYILF